MDLYIQFSKSLIVLVSYSASTLVSLLSFGVVCFNFTSLQFPYSPTSVIYQYIWSDNDPTVSKEKWNRTNQ